MIMVGSSFYDIFLICEKENWGRNIRLFLFNESMNELDITNGVFFRWFRKLVGKFMVFYIF